MRVGRGDSAPATARERCAALARRSETPGPKTRSARCSSECPRLPTPAHNTLALVPRLCAPVVFPAGPTPNQRGYASIRHITPLPSNPFASGSGCPKGRPRCSRCAMPSASRGATRNCPSAIRSFSGPGAIRTFSGPTSTQRHATAALEDPWRRSRQQDRKPDYYTLTSSLTA